ncbi:Antagonist of MEN (Mitotic Exit Network) [Sorochytrium milnesiophthora]
MPKISSKSSPTPGKPAPLVDSLVSLISHSPPPSSSPVVAQVTSAQAATAQKGIYAAINAHHTAHLHRLVVRKSLRSPSPATQTPLSSCHTALLIPELLACVLDFLCFQSDALFNCALVCRRWQAQAVPLLYRHLSLATQTTLQSLLRLAATSAPAQTRMTLCRSLLVEKIAPCSQLAVLAPLTPSLHHIEFYICPTLTDDAIVAFLSPQLRSLKLPGCANISDKTLLAAAELCPLLMHLDLRACSRITDKGIIAIVQACPRLQHLNVGRVDKPALVSDAVLDTLVDKTGQQQQRQQQWSRLLASHQRLDSSSSSSYSCNSSSSASHSRSSSTGTCPDLSSSLPPFACSAYPPATLSNVNTLGLAGTAVTDDGVLRLLQYCGGSLERISLNYTTRVTDRVLLAASQYGRCLTVLEIRNCPSISGTSDGVAEAWRALVKRKVLVEMDATTKRAMRTTLSQAKNKDTATPVVSQ